MNKARKKEIQAIADKLSALKDEVMSVRIDEEDAMSNIPKNLQESETYKASEKIIDTLDDIEFEREQAVDELQDIVDD